MQLFYAPNITPPHYTLAEEESKHCIRVLRMGVGDTLHITDGVGNLFCCRIIDANAKRCSVEVFDTFFDYDRLPYELTMAVAPTKSIERYEWFLEKATEVGVAEFVALQTDHSERKNIKLEREQKVITSAMKQSLKAYHPTLKGMTPFMDLIAQPFDGQKFIAHCAEPVAQSGKPHLADVVRRGGASIILIGAEGDFSPREIEAAVAQGFVEINLGTQRLRTETAAVVAVTIVATANRTSLD
ncbi:MAG: 16S rRNA (uracil(1498)-N(3))-methyltransferase [Rikenellaceae bacterium]